jgi:hypothetical protein
MFDTPPALDVAAPRTPSARSPARPTSTATASTSTLLPPQSPPKASGLQGGSLAFIFASRIAYCSGSIHTWQDSHTCHRFQAGTSDPLRLKTCCRKTACTYTRGLKLFPGAECSRTSQSDTSHAISCISLGLLFVLPCKELCESPFSLSSSVKGGVGLLHPTKAWGVRSPLLYSCEHRTTAVYVISGRAPWAFTHTTTWLVRVCSAQSMFATTQV